MSNGRLTAAELVTVQPGIQLALAPGHAWRMLVAAAARDRVSVWITDGGGYRDIGDQEDLTHSASGITVARPGFQTHGWGNRVDVGSFGARWGIVGLRRRAWLLKNGPKFGFAREFGEADPNHFKYTPVALTPTQEIDMAGIVAVHNKATAGKFAGWAGTMGVKYLRHFVAATPIANVANLIGGFVTVDGDAALIELAHAHGIGIAQLSASVATAVEWEWDGRAASTAGGLTAADLAAIDALDDDERKVQTETVLAAIANVPEATLAKFGLKRA